MKKSILIFLIIILLLPSSRLVFGANKCFNGFQDNTLCNPLFADNIYDLFFSPTGNAFAILLGLGLLIFATVYLVFAGFRMTMSAGDSEAIEAGKRGVQWVILGLVLTIFAYAITLAIMDFIGVKTAPIPTTGNVGVTNPLIASDFLTLLIKLLTGTLGLVSTLTMAMIIFSGFKYMTARGDDEQVTSAKSSLQWSIIGLLVCLFAYVIIKATLALFGQ